MYTIKQGMGGNGYIKLEYPLEGDSFSNDNEEILIKRIVLTVDNSMVINSSQTISVSIYPANATNKILNISSSDNNIISILNNSSLSANNVGNAYITVSALDGSKVTTSVLVNVTPVYVQTITLTGSNRLEAGETQQYNIALLPEESTNRTAILTANNNNVYINGDIVTGKLVGNTILTAATMDGSNLTSRLNLEIYSNINSVTITGDNEVELNKEKTLTVNVLPTTALIRTATLTSNNNNVSINGYKITGNNLGSSLITATTDDGSNITSTFNINVVSYITNISITGKSEMLRNETQTLTIDILPKNATNKTLVITSNNSNVTVNGNDIVSNTKLGDSIITVKSTDGSNINATFNISVVSKITDIEIVNTPLVQIYKSMELNANITPKDATNKTLLYTANNDNIEINGNIVTGKKFGTSIITATATDGSNVSTDFNIEVVAEVTNMGPENEEDYLGFGKIEFFDVTP